MAAIGCDHAAGTQVQVDEGDVVAVVGFEANDGPADGDLMTIRVARHGLLAV